MNKELLNKITTKQEELTDFVGKISEDVSIGFLNTKKDCDQLRELNEATLKTVKIQQAKIDVLEEKLLELMKK